MPNKPTINRVVVGTFTAGLLLLIAGAALIYHPLGFIVAGVELLLLASIAVRKA